MSPELCAYKFTVRPSSSPAINTLKDCNAPDFKASFLFNSFTEFGIIPRSVNRDLFVPPGENRLFHGFVFLHLFVGRNHEASLSFLLLLFIFLPQTHSMRETNGGRTALGYVGNGGPCAEDR